MGTPSAIQPTASLAAAGCLLLGLTLGQATAASSIAAACALGGLALAGPVTWRLPLLALALGLVASWMAPDVSAGLPAGVSDAGPVTATVRQRGDWRQTRDGWQVEVTVETLRQGSTVASWPASIGLYTPERPAGSRWRLRGHLRRPAPLRNAAGNRPRRWSLVVKSALLLEPLADDRVAAEAVRRVRQARRIVARRVALAGGSRPGGGLARALVLGDKSALPESTLQGLRRVGLAHVTALSGLHLGVLALWVAVLCWWAPPRWRWGLVAAVTLSYLALGGARASLLRSWLMVAAAGAAILSQRSSRSLHALAWSAVGLALLEPAAVGQLGFRMTFVATAGVVLGSRFLAPGWGSGTTSLARPLAATLGAQLATLPLTLAAFHWLPLWAWFWNLLIVPIVAAAVPVCFLWVAVAVADPSAAQGLLAPLDWLAAAVGSAGALPAGMLGGVPWASGGLATVALAAALWVAALRRRALAGFVVCLLFCSGSATQPQSHRTAVHFIDVGQGDATLVQDGVGALLVDGGGRRGTGLAAEVLLPVLGRLGLGAIEVAVLSHGDLDHCRGLLELARFVEVREVWLAPAAVRSRCGRQLVLIPGLRLQPLWAGHSARWRQWTFTVLNPLPGARGGGNEESLVLSGASRGRRLLLTGDIGHRTEFEILGRAAATTMEADLLKVAHHGSGGSTSVSFLRAARPALAVISAGSRNSFGHPSPRVLDRLARERVPVLRTDLSGLVEVSWGPGTSLAVRTPGAGD